MCISTRALGLGICLSVMLLAPMAAFAQATDLRLRIEWAGNTPVRWNGTFRLSEGTLGPPRLLGLQADEPGSIYLSQGQIHVQARTARRYDGFDVSVRAPRDARLLMTLTNAGEAGPGRTMELPLSRLIDGYDEASLEPTDHRLFVRRAPGDGIRVQISRPSLVFSPGEELELEIQPHEVELPAGATTLLTIELSKPRGGEVLWREQEEVTVGERGELSPARIITFAVPAEEGVYQTKISFEEKRISGRLVPKQLLPNKQLASRTIELVVIGAAQKDGPQPAWSMVMETDPVHPTSRWQRLMAHIPGFDKGPLKHGESATTTDLNGPMMQMAPGAWQAYPLAIRDIGQPHLLEIEYPDAAPQTFSLAILEPNQAGRVVSSSAEGGINVPALPAGHQPQVKRHRIIFWPRTKTPLLLINNWQQDKPAVFGTFRVLAGPRELPASWQPGTAGQRLLAAHFDSPRFTESYSVDRPFDASRGALLDDWEHFYRGSVRLARHLRFAGYNAASITVVSDGSALYPSRVLEPTPKHDTGVFFGNGADPLRKDVLEMLLRIFDREGLKLIPTVEFTAPLPELEKQKRSADDSPGIDLVNAEGRTWVQENGTGQGAAPYYNPVDPRVQKAIRRVVAEITDRYGGHASFGGVGLQLGPHDFTHFPHEAWGFDPVTVEQFFEDLGEPIDPKASHVERVQHLRGEAKLRWLNWRAHKLAQLYHAMQQDMAQRREDAALYLIPHRLLDAPRFWNEMRPTLPAQLDIEGIMLRLGIDGKLYARNPHIVLLRPRQASPVTGSIHEHAFRLMLNESPEMTAFFDRGKIRGDLTEHLLLTKRLPSFDQVSPFGVENTALRLNSSFVPSAFHNRQRFVHSLAVSDPQVLMEGGPILPLGGEEELRGLFDIYRRLPAARFSLVTPRGAESAPQGVVVRRLKQGGKTYFYLANDSPWPLTVEMRLAVPRNCGLVSLDPRDRPRLSPRDGVALWSVNLEPFDLTAAVLTSEKADIEDWRVRYAEPLLSSVKEELLSQVTDVRQRAHALHDQPPLTVLTNPGFEHSQGLAADWVTAESPGISIETAPRAGRQQSTALRIRHDGPVGPRGPFAWVRSEAFPTPPTGRLAISVWLRVKDEQKQPELRVAIEAKRGDEDFYRYYQVGKGKADLLKEEWTQFLFPFNSLPPDGLTDLRLGFDLMGPGEVLVDDVEVLDLWFRDHERQQLVLDVGRASLDLKEENFAACARFLQSYWPRLLLQHVSLSQARIAANPAPARSLDQPADQAPPADDKPSSTWSKLKNKATGWVPKFPSLW